MNLTKIAAVLTATSFGLWMLIGRQDAASAEAAAPDLVETIRTTSAVDATAPTAPTSDLDARQALAVVEPSADTVERHTVAATVVGRIVGTNGVEDKTKKSGFRLVGDVDFAGAKQVASAITPVPGGVGPMTIAMLLSNTVDAAEARGI